MLAGVRALAWTLPARPDLRLAQNSHPCLSFFFCPSKHEDGLSVLVDKVVEFSCSLWRYLNV